MHVTFWGVRGSIAVSGAEFARTGGNTTCVEVEHEGHRLILDGGTGLRALGARHGYRPMRATLLFTHLHWDHIQGVPFFTPAFHPDSDLTFLGPRRDAGVSLRAALAMQMKPPTFPVTLDRLVGARRFGDVAPGAPFETGPFRVTPLEQAHPDGVLVYRIEAGGRSLVFATDTEHGGRLDRSFVRLVEGVDLLVHDAQYTAAEYAGQTGPPRRGWGHTTWEEAVSLASTAAVNRLALFHHDPSRGDAAVEAIESLARLDFPRTFAAREGMGVAL